MELWEGLVDGYGTTLDVGSFSKVTQTAETVLKEDLAPFEIEWIAATLLFEPVSLLEQISLRARDDAWSKPLTDSFKVITILVDKYPESVINYHEDIVKTCQLPLDARARAAALHCLAACVARSLGGFNDGDVDKYIAALENPVTCKAPFAALVGAICEHRPEAVAEDVNRILRAYLNMLECNKNTDTVCAAALRGALQLLRYFGDALPVRELDLLYAPLAGELFNVPACRAVILEILTAHASLFCERLACDSVLRRAVWAAVGERGRAGACAANACLKLYKAVLSVPGQVQNLQTIVQAEIQPRTSDMNARIKFTALRVLDCARAHCTVRADALHSVDVLALEFQLRSEIDDVPDYVAEAVSWCVESGVPHSDVLLQTAILFHARLSAARVRDIITQGLRAAADRADGSLSFLLTETCQEGGYERYRPLWEALLEEDAAGLCGAVVNRAGRALRDAARGGNEIPTELLPLLRVAALALRAAPEHSAALSAPLCAALRCAAPAPALSLLPLLPDSEDVREVYERLDIERMPDEESLCACALALLSAPPGAVQPRACLLAVQIVMSRRDAEPVTLSRALAQLDALLNQRDSLDETLVSQVIRLVERLRTRTDLSGKEARVLHRDVLLFLGIYWDGAEHDNAENIEIEAAVVNLRDLLKLSVPQAAGDDYQINVQRILLLALKYEEHGSLEMLSAIICAHSSVDAETGAGQALRAGLAHALHARAHAAAREDAPPPTAPPLPALALPLLKQIAMCSSPGVRQVLCGLLPPLLRGDTVRHVALRVSDMLAAPSLTSRLGGLAASSPVLSALQEQSLLAQEFLPRLLLLIAASYEPASRGPFEQASALYADMRDLFSARALDSTVTDLLRTLTDLNVTCDGQVYKATVAMVVDFLRKVCDSAKVTELFRERDGDSAKWFYVLAKLKRVELSEVVLERTVVQNLIELNRATDFNTEVVLVYVTQFADDLLESYNEMTLALLGDVLETLRPARVLSLRARLAECVAAVSRGAARTPHALCRRLEPWADAQPLREIADHIKRHSFPRTHRMSVGALRVLLETLSPPHPAQLLTDATALARAWPRTVLEYYAEAPTDLEPQTPYLTDVLAVALRLGAVDDLRQLLSEGHSLRGVSRATLGVDFCRHFMPAFHRYLLRTPFVLCEPGMEACCTLLRDVVEHCAASHHVASDNLVELADELWDTFAARSSAATCGVVLHQLRRAGAAPPARCVAWALRAVGEPQRPPDERGALLFALPLHEDSTPAYLSFVATLPARLSDCTREHARALRAVLDAVAVEPHPVLLDLLVRLAAGDESAGWWDAAMEACMASLALRGEANGEANSESSPLSALFRRLDHDPLSAATCTRLFVPLFSYSPAGACERFLGAVLPALLCELRDRQVAVSPSGAYHRCVVRNTRHAILLRLMVEKVPRGSLESPASALHVGLAAGNASLRPWHAVREACKLFAQLRKRTVVPDNATPELARVVLEFQQAAYNTLAACACVWRASPALFDVVLGAAWDSLVGSEPYNLPLRARQRRSTLMAAGGVGAGAAGGGTGTVGSSTGGGTTRQSVFLRTLSENPNNFDLFDEQEEQSERVEIVVSSGGLNCHPCAGALSALLRHLAAARPPAPAWQCAVAAALATARTNVRWLLAQCVVNVRVELRADASALSPALLAVVADTAEGGLLNSLHVDILETVSEWAEPGAAPPPALSAAASVAARTYLQRRDSAAAGALLECCRALFRAFPQAQLSWQVFQPHLDDPGAVAACFKLLTRAAKEGVHLPELVPALLQRVAEGHRKHYQTSDLAKLFNAAVVTCDDAARRSAWADYSKLASRVKVTSVSDYIDMLHYASCTDMQHFSAVADVAQKAPALRRKCLSILAASLRAAPAPGAALAVLPPDLRRELDDMCVDWAFQEALSPAPSSPVAKRARLSAPRLSPLLDTRGDEPKFARALARLKDAEARLDEILAVDDMALRFVECFYACVYLPLKHPPPAPRAAPACLTAALRLWLRRLRTQHRFQRAELPQPAGAADPARPACGSFVGSLRTHAFATHTARAARTSLASKQVTAAAVQNAAVSVEQVLDTFLNFGQSHGSASAWLTAQVWRACSARASSDLSAALAGMLASLLDAAPELLELARELAPTLQALDGLEERVESLWALWSGTEAEPELRLLREELQLRRPAPELFVLGNDADVEEKYDVREDGEFTIEGLVLACGALASWDTLTVPQRRRAARLPPLWTDRDDFRRKLEEFTPEGSGWFQRMVCAWRGERRNVPCWVRAAAAWPRRRTDLAALAEALGAGAPPPPPRPAPSDCLAEWAARLMLRSLYLSEATGDDALSRSHELEWCRCATEMGLPRLALQCVQRNTRDEMSEGEALAWLCARAGALLAQGRGEGDARLLEKALLTAERHGPRLFPAAAVSDVLELCVLIVQLRTELDSLSNDRVEEVLQWAETATRRGVTARDKDSLRALSETVILHYHDDGVWDRSEPNTSLSAMCGALSVAVSHGCAGAAGTAALIIRLSGVVSLQEDVADRLLRTMLPLLESLPACYWEQLQHCLHVFPARALSTHATAISRLRGESHNELRRCIQLLCGAEPALLQHCVKLRDAADKHRGSEWAAAFKAMEQEIFENPCAGADYRALHQHKRALYAVQNYADSSAWRRQSLAALQSVVAALSATQRARRSVSALCPALCVSSPASPASLDVAAGLATLLQLPAQDVIGFDDEISVFTDAVTAPGVVSVRLRSGRRRYVLKRAALAKDAAAALAAAALAPDHHVAKVILVTEDCGLIEYLEEHERMRDLINEGLELKAIPTERQARRNEELILAPALASERNYAQICAAAPPAALRRAVERRCADAGGFERARRRFRRDLVSMTVLTWLLGLGDRHLNNIMVETSAGDGGGVRAVDWDAVFQYGQNELPPARLTRMLQAVCPDGLEAELQQAVQTLRRRTRALLPVLLLALGRAATPQQLLTLQELVAGRLVPCSATQLNMSRDKPHADHYLQLLRDTCAGAHEPGGPRVCSVQEQVACLLRMSTAPRVLAVTRSEWEPWL